MITSTLVTALMVAVFGVGGSGSKASAASDRLRRVGCVWSVVRSVALPGASLDAVAADAPDDAWAVGGSSGSKSGRQARTVVEHWNGRGWSTVASPPVAGALLDVAVSDLGDAWTVGELTDAAGNPVDAKGNGFGGLAEHWAGRGWRRVPLPPLQRLRAVASTPWDAWTVGEDKSGAAVVLRWDGSSWQTRLRLLNVYLLDVAALSPTDVWAVGGTESQSQPRFLEAHWNGRRWSTYTQPSPNGGSGPDAEPSLNAIAASSENDIWAAGDADQSGDPAWPDTVVYHWNGTSWRRAPAPTLVWISDLATRTQSDVWVASVTGNGDAHGNPELEEQVNPSPWQRIPLAAGQDIAGLASDQAHGLWGVGFVGSYLNGLGYPTYSRALIKRAHCS